MTRYLSSKQQERAPFHLVVTLNACRCNDAPEYMGTARTVERLVPSAVGYWELYKAFWGHLPRLITVSIVDVRDGTVMWRNGRHLTQEASSEHTSNDEVAVNQATRGGHSRSGRPATPNRVTGGYGN